EYYVIREYLVPGWLISVQFFVTIAFVLGIIALGILSLVIIRLPLKAVLQYEWIFIKSAFICIAISSVFMFLGVVIFGSCAYRRDWLMYPKFNVLSWSYALAVVSFMVLGLAALVLHRESKNAYEIRGEAKNLVMQMEMQEPGFQHSRHHHKMIMESCCSTGFGAIDGLKIHISKNQGELS
uniref:MARVEL domain-containing protein n=1 Tax=Megaselia scalaris TaxID=36166 RepID=T1GK52_MEGSC